MEQRQTTEQFKGQSRLPKFAIPHHYDLYLKPDLSVCSFSGTEYHACEVVLDGDDEILILAFQETLGVGEGVLRLGFSGMLNEHLRGFYRCTYLDGEEKKNMAVTQFEPVDARRCFPCWDEPALKATFKITLDVPPELTALSNMPVIDEKLDGNVKTVHFAESPVMPTYLVAVVIGLFDHIEETTKDGTNVRVYCPLGKSNEGKYALSLAVKALDLFTEYFSMPYPLPKLDMVAVPEFSGGAMENFGLIVYRENELLYHDLRSTASRKQIVEINHARSVNEIFDDISYKKGSAVIRMLQGYLGDDIIQKSLSSYMKKYAWRNAKTEDLWDVLSEESGIKVSTMMDNWTKQKGYPVISVKHEDTSLEFEQSQFLSTGLNGDGKWIVPITLVLGSYNRRKNFLLESKVEKVDISDMFPPSYGHSSSSEEPSDEKCTEHNWIKVNIEQSGFYRVKYEEKLAALLRGAVEKNLLSASDKFGILDDSYALCEACETSLSSLLSLLDVYGKEHDYAVLLKLIDVCYRVVEISMDAVPSSVEDLKKFFINLLLYSAERVAPLQAAYISVMRNASAKNRTGFESLLKIYRECDSIHEKELILDCLASCPDPEIVLEVLNLLVSDEVRDQDIIYGLRGISLEGRETAWTWLKENWDLILKRYGDGLLITHFVRDIVTPFCSNEKADEVEEFFSSHANSGITMNLKQSIELVRIKARWVQSIKQEHSLDDLIKQLALKG
ncbi:hypothetical protein Tsubulata_018469 [Turnera subulata]|uniref:Aminopeptidase n=1 Tax=Turnera subulata TaxID=218843 RepID=A0A9Q0FUY4_9ROSI|nr:hypothetical protein Tsubulata_018469 [Turnera subulata]